MPQAPSEFNFAALAGTLDRMAEALERLARSEPLHVQLIEMRYFGGMTGEECAAVLGLPVTAVRRELRLAQSWLHREVSR